MGKELQVNTEDFINRSTALFGSGPAYVALFAESLVG
jgi:pyrroline-5-carboxylate reductase